MVEYIIPIMIILFFIVIGITRFQHSYEARKERKLKERIINNGRTYSMQSFWQYAADKGIKDDFPACFAVLYYDKPIENKNDYYKYAAYYISSDRRVYRRLRLMFRGIIEPSSSEDNRVPERVKENFDRHSCVYFKIIPCSEYKLAEEKKNIKALFDSDSFPFSPQDIHK